MGCGIFFRGSKKNELTSTGREERISRSMLGGTIQVEVRLQNLMSDTFEFRLEDHPSTGAVNGLVCAFALLIDVLEANGSLKPKQFETVLGKVLRQPGVGSDEDDVGVLEQIMSLLQSPERPTLTVIAGGKT